MNYKKSLIIYSLISFIINGSTPIYAFSGINKSNISIWTIFAIVTIFSVLVNKKHRSTIIGVAIGLMMFYFTVQYIRVVLDI
jgi:hypothetical protein